MTREEKQKAIEALKISVPIMAVTQEEFNDYIQTLNKVMDWLEQEPTTKNDLGVDINIQALLEKTYADFCSCEGGEGWLKIDGKEYPTDAGYALEGMSIFMEVFKRRLAELPSVTPQEPKIGHCKDCKWWKDSDGAYRRGVGAESQCPINRREVFEGSGYCYLFEPQESEEI